MVRPLKNFLYTYGTRIASHLLLFSLFAILPFIFSDALLETETTARFILSAGILTLASVCLALTALSGQKLNTLILLKSPLFIILFFFLLILGLGVVRSLNQGEALYDYLKYFTFCGYLILFILLIKNDEGFLILLLKYVNLSVGIFTLIALSQLGNKLGLVNRRVIDYSLGSSLGNKNFYAETIALLLPLCLLGTLLLNRSSRIWSWVNIVLIIITIFALQTLSALVAMALCSVIVMLIWRRLRSSGFLKLEELDIKISRKQIITASVLIAVSVLLLSLGNQRYKGLFMRIDRVKSYVLNHDAASNKSIKNLNSISERLFLWKNALRVFKAYPLTGAGLDNWKVYAAKYQLPFQQIENVRYVRPHNDWLLYLAEEGLPGLLLFAGLFISAFILAFRSLRSSTHQHTKLIVLAALSGLMLYAFIAFVSLPGDRFYTQIMLFLYLAIIAALSDRMRESLTTSPILTATILTCFVVGSVACSYAAIQRLKSELHLIYALKGASKRQWDKMKFHASRADTWYFPMDYTGTPISWYEGMAYFNEGESEIAKLYFEKALRVNPYHIQVLNDMGTVQEKLGDPESAEKTYDKVLAMSPLFSTPYFNKVVMTYNKGQKQKAYDMVHEARNMGMSIKVPIYEAILMDKIKTTIQDSLTAAKYIKKNQYILRQKDSIALSQHITFEDLVAREAKP
jgi:O-antigen ligase